MMTFKINDILESRGCKARKFLNWVAKKDQNVNYINNFQN